MVQRKNLDQTAHIQAGVSLFCSNININHVF